MRRLEPGMVGPDVERWRRVLVALGLEPGEADKPQTKFGPKLFDATKAFQRRAGLTESGAVNTGTARLAALELAELAGELVTE